MMGKEVGVSTLVIQTTEEDGMVEVWKGSSVS